MQRMERADMNWNLKKLSQLSVSIFNDMPEKIVLVSAPGWNSSVKYLHNSTGAFWVWAKICFWLTE